jgi:hypothetical protein
MSDDYGGGCVTIMKSERTRWVGMWHAWDMGSEVYEYIRNVFKMLGQEITREIYA